MAISQTTVETWLTLQGRLIAGLRSALVELTDAVATLGGTSARFPNDRIDTSRLLPAVAMARNTLAPVVNGGADVPLRIAYPLRRAGQLLGAIAVEVDAPLARQQAVLQLLEWGEAWLNLILDQQQARPQAADAGWLPDHQLFAQRGSYADFAAAALALLPRQTACSRVALGHVSDAGACLEGLSDNVEMAQKSNRVRALEGLFGETAAAGRSLSWPTSEANDGGGHHRAYAERYRVGGLVSVPWPTHDGATLVLTFEFAEKGAWQAEAARCEQAAQLLFPLMELERELGRGTWSRSASLLREGVGSFGRSMTRVRALAAAAVFAVVLFALLGTGAYRITASAVLEGAIQRAVVAPFDGFIASAEVRAGETVSAGQVMAQLDDKDLLAEQRRLRSSRAEIQKEYRKALAELDHAQARILQAKIAQADARVAHLDDQLARARLTAPLDGMVITGDWTRSLDAPVDRGDVLFEVAPLADYRVVLLVKDSDIALLKPGQPGELRLTGLPGVAIPLIVGEVATLAEPDAEGALFRVEATPQDQGLALRPGMEGIAKVVVGERRRLWIWTHGLTDWLRMQLWRWWP